MAMQCPNCGGFKVTDNGYETAMKVLFLGCVTFCVAWVVGIVVWIVGMIMKIFGYHFNDSYSCEICGYSAYYRPYSRPIRNYIVLGVVLAIVFALIVVGSIATKSSD